MSSLTQYNPGSTDTPLDPQLLEDLSPAQSLMDRVAQNQSLLQDTAQRKQRFVQDSLLSNQPLQQQRLALAQATGAQQVGDARASADVAVTDSTYRAAQDDATWREQNAAELAQARAQLPSVLDAINQEPDPTRINDAAAVFHGRYSHLAQDRVLGDQYKALDQRIAGRLQARNDEVRARISAVVAGFRPYIDPANPEQLDAIRSSPFYPAARLDPTFAQQMDDATKQSAALALHAAREAAAPAADSFASTGSADAAQARALQVDGYAGQAPTPENAQWFSRLNAATARVEDDAGRLLNIANTPNSSLSPIELKNARSRAERLRATLAQDLFVPDVVSDADRQLVDDLVTNPAKLLDPSSSEALQNFVGRLQANRELNAGSLGLTRQRAPAADPGDAGQGGPIDREELRAKLANAKQIFEHLNRIYTDASKQSLDDTLVTTRFDQPFGDAPVEKVGEPGELAKNASERLADSKQLVKYITKNHHAVEAGTKTAGHLFDVAMAGPNVLEGLHEIHEGETASGIGRIGNAAVTGTATLVKLAAKGPRPLILPGTPAVGLAGTALTATGVAAPLFIGAVGGARVIYNQKNAKSSEETFDAVNASFERAKKAYFKLLQQARAAGIEP